MKRKNILVFVFFLIVLVTFSGCITTSDSDKTTSTPTAPITSSSPANVQKLIEEKSTTVRGKLIIINVTNDMENFYIILKNDTEYRLFNDNGNDKFDISESSNLSEVQVIIKDNSGVILANYIVNNYTEQTAKFRNRTEIAPQDEGEIQITVGKINPGTIYTITINAAGVTTTVRLCAI